MPVPGSEFVVPAETVVVAIGNHPLVPQTTPGMAVTRRATSWRIPETSATPRPGLFAGGDIVTGAATVIPAMGAGPPRRARHRRYLDTLPPKSDA